jgi:hypothetical protein
MAAVIRTVNSSWIRSARWDNETKELVIRTAKGSYVHHDVPEDIFNGLCDASSGGDYWHQHIKGRYT